MESHVFHISATSIRPPWRHSNFGEVNLLTSL